MKGVLAKAVPSGLKGKLLGWYYRSDDLPVLSEAERAELSDLLVGRPAHKKRVVE